MIISLIINALSQLGDVLKHNFSKFSITLPTFITDLPFDFGYMVHRKCGYRGKERKRDVTTPRGPGYGWPLGQEPIL